MTRATLLTLSLLLATNWSHAADPAAAKTAAKLILEKGWDKTAAARKLVDSEFASAATRSPDDPILLAAHWMTLANQNRYEEARPSLIAFLKSRPQYLPALRAKAWIHTVLKNYKEAMDAADALSQVIAQAPPPADSSARAEQEEAVEFLGRFVGYLEAPLENVVDQGQRKKLEAQLVARLNRPQAKLFEQGKDTVSTKLGKLQKLAAGEVQEAKEAADAAKQKKLEGLEKEQERFADDAKKVEQREAKAAEQLKQTLEKLNQQLATANNKIILLQNQRTRFANQLNQDQANAQRAQQRAAQEQNDQIRQRYQFEAQQAQNTAQGTQRQIDNVDGQIINTQAQYNNFQQQIQGTQAGGAIQGKAFDNQRLGLEQDNKKNAGRQKRAAGTKDNSAAKASAPEIQIRAFSTYAKLPLDELRASLLSKLQ